MGAGLEGRPGSQPPRVWGLGPARIPGAGAWPQHQSLTASTAAGGSLHLTFPPVWELFLLGPPVWLQCLSLPRTHRPGPEQAGGRLGSGRRSGISHAAALHSPGRSPNVRQSLGKLPRARQHGVAAPADQASEQAGLSAVLGEALKSPGRAGQRGRLHSSSLGRLQPPRQPVPGLPRWGSSAPPADPSSGLCCRLGPWAGAWLQGLGPSQPCICLGGS